MSKQGQSSAGIGLRVLRFTVGLIFGILIPAAIVAAGGYGAYYLIKTSPQAERKNGAKNDTAARLVEAMRVEAGKQQIVIDTMGLVTPARAIDLQPRVEGELVEVHPDLEPGGFLEAGVVIARIDPVDYELAVRQAEAAVAQMESALKLEMGQQEVAREEFELLGETLGNGDSSLVLREPQLEAARADLERAKASLRTAELSLQRTVLKAPFNSIVQAESVESGAIVSRNETVARLVGTDTFWVELSVPVDTLRWIELPGRDGEGGSLVRIYDEAAWGAGAHREGRVIRYAASLDEQSRTARLVVAVDDPLAMGQEKGAMPRMLLGSYVSGMIQGTQIPNAVAFPRQHLRQDDTVWVMTKEGRLEIREVEVLWRGKTEVVVVDGLYSGEWIVTSNLTAPVDGMRIRTNGESPVEYEHPEEKTPVQEAETPGQETYQAG
jgi:RND family efflux transporter MFP subunit